MKTKYKISIIGVAVVAGVFLTVLPTMTITFCDDKILNLDDCGNYLEEKYSKQSMFKHFASMYPDAERIGFESSMFKAENVFASSILDDKVYVSLEMDLDDLTFHYACQNHNLEDDYIIFELENIAISDLDNNNCLTLNQIEVDLEEPASCKNYVYTNKPPKIYNITPTSDGAIIQWYQTPQTINGERCGFPKNYQIFVGLVSPVVPPFEFSDESIPAGFRGDYRITGLESNTTYYVDLKGDWETKVISSDKHMSFTTLGHGEIPNASNPIEETRDRISGNFTVQK